jgi:hypothetical protein
MKAIPFTIATKFKCLEINLNKDVKEFYNENYKTSIKEIIKDLKK